MTTYCIKRFLQDGPTATVRVGLTRDEAKAHCQQPDTRGEGWFDGFEDDESAEVDVEAGHPERCACGSLLWIPRANATVFQCMMCQGVCLGAMA